MPKVRAVFSSTVEIFVPEEVLEEYELLEDIPESIIRNLVTAQGIDISDGNTILSDIFSVTDEDTIGEEDDDELDDLGPWIR